MDINKLVEQNMIQRLEVPGHFERYDKVLSHDHFICLNCSKIIDLEKSNIRYDKILQGNLVMNCKISYEGICQDCLQEKGADINGIKGK